MKRRLHDDEMNAQRSLWAGTALAVHQKDTGADDDAILWELLANLMHWTDRNGKDFDEALVEARGLYEIDTGTD